MSIVYREKGYLEDFRMLKPERDLILAASSTVDSFLSFSDP